MTDSREVLTRPAPPPDLTLSYGPHPDHVIDVRLPARPSNAPLVVVLHGGFWRSEYDRTHTGPMASALAAAGYVVAVPEYRRTGQEGGGWPGTFTDVAAALDAVPSLLSPYTSTPPVLLGHSAGGHLALWAACRTLSPLDVAGRAGSSPGVADGTGRPGVAGGVDSSPEVAGEAGSSPGVAGRTGSARVVGRATPLRGVVSLAGCADLVLCSTLGLDDGATDLLLGGSPAEVPDRYRAADPAQLPRPKVPVTLLHGTSDDRVPVAVSRSYATRTGAPLRELPGYGHFALIDPLSGAWPAVLEALR